MHGQLIKGRLTGERNGYPKKGVKGTSPGIDKYPSPVASASWTGGHRVRFDTIMITAADLRAQCFGAGLRSRRKGT